ncbi:MAG: adenylyltransferase/cytidyltransferase family protein [Thiolinea sp.]
MRNDRKVVITYGTFDLFHIGHLRLLQRAREMGDYLIVGVSTDEFNRGKNKETVIPYDQRAEIVNNMQCVDAVIPECTWEQKRNDVMNYGVDLFVMGADWRGHFDFLNTYCQVEYLERTPDISTTLLKSHVKCNKRVRTAPLMVEEVMGLPA